MNAFQKRAAWRIALVSVLLACLASPLAGWVARERLEEGIVALAIEESGRLLHHFDAIDLSGPQAQVHAQDAAHTIVGGLFDIAEIYDPQGRKLAEALTREGRSVEAMLPNHGRPGYTAASYEGVKLPGDLWVLRVFVPLRDGAQDPSRPVTGYFEGVRVVPPWQREQIVSSALMVAAMVGLASLVCGAVLYPVVVRLSQENERKAREVLDSHISMMEALGRAIAKRDSDTGAHNYRVAWIASGIAQAMGIRGAQMQALIACSFLHDVGKIGIPDAILLKPGRLTPEEFAVMRTHVDLGKDVVRGAGWLDGAQDVVACHHEKWNGQGYPQGLAGQDIPLSARIFAVADVFDALCSKRPYKEPLGFDEVMAILQRDTGSHFDPAVMAVFAPMARHVYDQLAACDEAAARALLAARVRQHFDA